MRTPASHQRMCELLQEACAFANLSAEEQATQPVRIKLCGMFRSEDIQAVNQARPDLCGFIVDFPKSHRNVDACQLQELTAMLDVNIPAVGVFVDQSVNEVAALANTVLDAVQLHGAEDVHYISDLRTKTDVPIIQVFKIASPEDVERANQSPADLVLLDSGQGTGRTFNWEHLSGVARPYLLAGGLSPDNLEEAIHAKPRPWGVDLSSGIETNNLKDAHKIAASVAVIQIEPANPKPTDQRRNYDK